LVTRERVHTLLEVVKTSGVVPKNIVPYQNSDWLLLNDVQLAVEQALA
jgi:hypothetical protein